MSAPAPGILSLVPFVSVENMMRIVWAIGVERMIVGARRLYRGGFPPLGAVRQDAADRRPFGRGGDRADADQRRRDLRLQIRQRPSEERRRGAPDRDRLRRAVACRQRLSDADLGDDDPDRAAHRRDLGAGGEISRAARARGRWRSSATGRSASSRRSRSRRCAASRRCGSTTSTRRRRARRCANLAGQGIDVVACGSNEEAILGAEIVTTCTADKRFATILTDNMIGAGVHINAIGGDCPGKTELARDILLRSDIFVEYAPQTRIEGEIQQLDKRPPGDRALAGDRRAARRVGATRGRSPCSTASASPSRTSPPCATSATSSRRTGHFVNLDLLADPDDPRDLFGMVLRARPRPA